MRRDHHVASPDRPWRCWNRRPRSAWPYDRPVAHPKAGGSRMGEAYPGRMPLEVNRPDVLAAVTAVFERYEAALVTNDVETLDELFWQSPDIVASALPIASKGSPRCRLSVARSSVRRRRENFATPW